MGESEIENRNPSDLSDLIGLFAQASTSDLTATLDQARIAQAEWAAYGMERKQTVLMNIGNELMARAEELGTLLSREEGKPLVEGKGEVYRAGQFFTFYAAECLRQLGENAPIVCATALKLISAANRLALWAVISPWNFPIATAAWKIAPALCYGNAVIWKPANATPASAVCLDRNHCKTGHSKGAFQPNYGVRWQYRPAIGRKPTGGCYHLYRLGAGGQGDCGGGHSEPHQSANGNGI